MACGRGGGSAAALGTLATATLVPGESAGPLQLGRTTLREFTTRYGSGRPSGLIGDDLAFEFGFADGEFSALFVARGECLRSAQAHARDAVDALREPARFVAAYPACADEVLHSVAFAAPRGHALGFFRGRTDAGIGLDTPAAAVIERYGVRQSLRGLQLAGGSGADASMEQLDYASGVSVFIANSPSGANAGRLVARKIVVFKPTAAAASR